MTSLSFLSLLALSASARACTEGIDYPDGDLPSMPIVLPTFDVSTGQSMCASMCAAEPQCAISVTLDSGCDADAGGAAVCYLKLPGVAPASRACRCGGNVSRAVNPSPAPGAPGIKIYTAHVSATFGTRGLLNVSVDGITATVAADTFALALDGVVVNSSALADPSSSAPDAESAQFVFSSPPYTITVLYEARDDWRFVRKTVSVLSSAPVILVGSVSPFDTLVLSFSTALVGAVYPTGNLGTYGVFGRFADGTGVVAAATNPFLYPSIAQAFGPTSTLIHVGYHPALAWNVTTSYDSTPRPFVADAGLIGFYALSPNAVPPALEDDMMSTRYGAMRSYLGGRASRATDTLAGMLFEYESLAAAGSVSLPAALHLFRGRAADPSWLNYAERDAFRALGEAHFLLPPARPIRVHIPWTENDYQIDIANATQWPEYMRILTQLSRIGVDRILYAGGNSAVSNVSSCEDDWCWENVLWLAYGEQLRKGEWAPGSPIADSVNQLIITSEALGVSAIPYVYPILGFTANRTSPPPWWVKQSDGKEYSTLSNREFQDYFINTTVSFSQTMGSFGAGYDYTYFFSGGSSVYSQFFGWRRILSTVRETLTSSPDAPQYVVDNRQSSHEWSPWMWTAGSYAEPLQSDEQTTSWTAYVQDIHIDRTDGNRQREMNYDYAQSKLCQPSAMPGFFHHNTDRGDNRRTDLSIRDFDFYGAPYTIVSAVATGGLNLVVCDVAARDEGEFSAFPIDAPDNRTVSVNFYRSWFDWVDAHVAHLHNIKFLAQPPAPGVIDGTYAMVNGTGFVFLFNPNAQSITTPDGLLTASAASLDTTCAPGDELTVGELWPYPAPSILTVQCGANFSVTLDGRSARVLTIGPSAAGDVQAAAAETLRRATPAFVHNSAVTGMEYNASFVGGLLEGTVRVPAAVFAQLTERAAAYPVEWTTDDAQIAWLNPSRLLVSIDVNRAVQSTAVITATLAGAAVPVFPVWSCRNDKVEKCFQGFAVDLSAAGVVADTDYAFTVSLPSMQAGVFGGVHYDNVDTIY